MFSLVILIVLSSYVSAYVYCPQKSDTDYAYKIPKHSCACNAKNAGTLRYHEDKVQFCNGKKYVNLANEEKKPLGSEERPAKSCKEIYASNSKSDNGEYYLSVGNDKTISTYCIMDNICGSRGWAMIMKINGQKETFGYNSAYWSNKLTYNEEGAKGGLDGQETKLETYFAMPFDALCLGMKTGNNMKWIFMQKSASSLYSLIADGKYRSTNLGRGKWKSLVPNSSLQRYCNKEGFNARENAYAMARIGIISNQENDCESPDSRIGFGTAGDGCGQNTKHSAGNDARCSPDNGDKSIPSFGYILAQ